MIRRSISALQAAGLSILLVLGGCGKNGVTPTPINPNGTGNSLGEQITQTLCAETGDVDSDGDGICDTDEANDPTLGPDCVDNPDCNNNETPDGDEPSWWVKNRKYVWMASALGAGSVYLVKACDGNGDGCNFLSNVAGKTGDDVNNQAGWTTSVIGNLTGGYAYVKLDNMQGRSTFKLGFTAKSDKRVVLGGIDLGYDFGGYIAGFPQFSNGASFQKDATGAAKVDLPLAGVFSDNLKTNHPLREFGVPCVSGSSSPGNVFESIEQKIKDLGYSGYPVILSFVAQADGNQDCWFAKSLLPESVFNAAKPSTLTLKFPPLGKTAEATFSLHSEHPEVGAVIDSFDFVAKWVGKVGGPDLTNPASGLPTNPVENYADGYQYWPKLEKALGLNSPQVSCSNMTCSIKNLFSPLQNLYAVFEMTRSQ